jgi:hypothetical protein
MPDRDGRGTEPDSAARRRAAGVPVDRADPADSSGASGDANETTEAPPRAVTAVGQAGVYLAVVSLGTAVVGVAALAAGIQPYGNIATVLALAGVSAAMVVGMAYQAYVGDYRSGQ